MVKLKMRHPLSIMRFWELVAKGGFLYPRYTEAVCLLRMLFLLF